MRSRGFTLIELIAVITILGLMAGATGLSLIETARSAALDRTIGMLQQEDERARLAARRLGREVVLRIDLDEQRLQRFTRNPAGELEPAASRRLPAGTRLTDLLGMDTPADPDPVIDLVYARGGQTRTFAWQIETEQNQRLWLLTAGLTGQTRTLEDQDLVERWLAIPAPPGPDAD